MDGALSGLETESYWEIRLPSTQYTCSLRWASSSRRYWIIELELSTSGPMNEMIIRERLDLGLGCVQGLPGQDVSIALGLWYHFCVSWAIYAQVTQCILFAIHFTRTSSTCINPGTLPSSRHQSTLVIFPHHSILACRAP